MEREEDRYLAKMHAYVKLKKPRESFSRSIKKGKRKRTREKSRTTKKEKKRGEKKSEEKRKRKETYIYIYISVIEKNSGKMNYMKSSPRCRFSMDETSWYRRKINETQHPGPIIQLSRFSR